MGMPNIVSKSILCGDTIEIDVLDENCAPITYRITAGLPSVPGGSLPRPGPGGPDDPTPRVFPSVPITPAPGSSFSAQIIGDDAMPTAGDLENVGVFLNAEVLPANVVPGQQFEVHVVTVRHVRGERVTFDLPEALRHEDGADVTLMLGLD